MTCRILYISSPFPDYLSAGLFHGIRTLLGEKVVDWPRYDSAYRDYPMHMRHTVHGRGYTTFFQLSNANVDRSRIRARIATNDFDCIIFSDIVNQMEILIDLFDYLNPKTTVLIDGQDGDPAVPHMGQWWRDPVRWHFLGRTKTFFYYKREWTENTQFNLWHRLIPAGLRSLLPVSPRLRPISFSIPASKILTTPPAKKKILPLHIVDPEVAMAVPEAQTAYAFSTEEEYYRDLQESKFGITTKRAGWDCMRHYEIAANGAVPCFRRLSEKPLTAAPHGLVHGRNCLDYRDADDLMKQIYGLDPIAYERIQAGSFAWVRRQTTIVRAMEFLDSLRKDGVLIE